MVRVPAVIAVLLLAGCLASPEPEATASAVDDGLLVAATRVEPLLHSIDAAGRIENQVCAPPTPDGPCQHFLAPGPYPLVGQGPVGTRLELPTVDVGDPQALYWRVQLQADWDAANFVTLRMVVYATRPCGIACVTEREVAVNESVDSMLVGSQVMAGRVAFDGLEVFLQPGETGIRVRLQATSKEFMWGETGVNYHLQGVIAGYRAVADAVIIG